MTQAMELRDLAVDVAGRPVLRGIDLSVAPGEIVGVLGANGSGKTTLVRAALGLAPLRRGEARLGGRPVATLSNLERSDLAAYLPQERRVGWNMPAWRIAVLGAPHRPPLQARALALAALTEAGVEALAERGVRDMSGGERARVLLARMLVTGAPLLVADEPAAGLDPDAAFRVMEILRARAERGGAVVATLHDLTLAVRTCDRLAVLQSGRLVALGPPQAALNAEILALAFGLDGEVMESPAGPVVAARRRPGSQGPPPAP
jgi:iron complex transport system ATP-binding protein